MLAFLPLNLVCRYRNLVKANLLAKVRKMIIMKRMDISEMPARKLYIKNSLSYFPVKGTLADIS